MTSLIKTKRLNLIPLTTKQIKDIFKLYSNKELLKYTDSDCLKSENDAIGKIQWFYDGERNKFHIYRGISMKKNEKIIGTIGIYEINYKHSFASVSFLLDKEFWNKGIMTEAAMAFLRFIFNNIDLNRIEAQVFTGNNQSIRMIEKLPFVREGCLRENFLIDGKFEDSYVYSVIRSDFPF